MSEQWEDSSDAQNMLHEEWCEERDATMSTAQPYDELRQGILFDGGTEREWTLLREIDSRQRRIQELEGDAEIRRLRGERDRAADDLAYALIRNAELEEMIGPHKIDCYKQLERSQAKCVGLETELRCERDREVHRGLTREIESADDYIDALKHETSYVQWAVLESVAHHLDWCVNVRVPSKGGDDAS